VYKFQVLPIHPPLGNFQEINMVFQLPLEFSLPEREVTRLELGAERAVFKKPKQLGQHMKLLYI
jgi:hypothetical protein